MSIKLSDLTAQGTSASLSITVTHNAEQKTVTVQTNTSLNRATEGYENNSKSKTYKYNQDAEEVIPSVESDTGLLGVIEA